MDPYAFLKTVAEQFGSLKTRSTVLQSLQWQTLIYVSGAVGAAGIAGQEAFLTKALLGMAALDFLFYRGAYWYFAVKDRSLLHTEEFRLSQMSLENERVEHGNLSDQSQLTSQDITELINGTTVLLDHQPVDGQNISVFLPEEIPILLWKNGKIRYRIEGKYLVIEDSNLRRRVAEALASGKPDVVAIEYYCNDTRSKRLS